MIFSSNALRLWNFIAINQGMYCFCLYRVFGKYCSIFFFQVITDSQEINTSLLSSIPKKNMEHFVLQHNSFLELKLRWIMVIDLKNGFYQLMNCLYRCGLISLQCWYIDKELVAKFLFLFTNYILLQKFNLTWCPGNCN